MSNRTLRMLLCAATMAVVGTFGTAARATVYDLGWDPMFAGDIFVNIDPSCLVSDGVKSCLVNPVASNFFDSLGREWGIAPGPAALDLVSIVGGKLFALDLILTPFAEFDGGCSEPPPTLTFSIDPKQVTFACGSLPIGDNTATYTSTVVPEPATLALLGLGLTVAGFAGSRRRKPR